ncbi:outer membrane lipoprotein chaperone LolA [Shewanella fodinae]|jgi:outer membrane lipoprotein carrier protein|uniref:outer membrane lipoprotein chaperone LolA n=1 Tax=Shewanella fodinae TaxID=552357 RepID=UPI00167A0F26|nr:outer membrane lipoprotein chaperone LolA [Shewanella fodinae]MCL2905537.1 outer membrane lipoprotein chaperone LolA [Shewanella fodinae]GGY91841.1 outer-membrane lipoprotein carrier protein [Shewanella fodinae]
MKKLLLSALLLTCMQAQAQTAEQTLKVKLDANPALKASFTQTVTDINGKQIQSGSGTLALSQPNRFYWHLTQPDESLIVADGKDVWIYNPFAEEVSVLGLRDAIAASPITLLVHRDKSTWAKFTIRAKGKCFDILPKAADTGIQQVEVCFDGNTLTRLSLDDTQGNNSVFELSNQQSLTNEDNTLFSFTPPEGVSVDDQRPHDGQ